LSTISSEIDEIIPFDEGSLSDLSAAYAGENDVPSVWTPAHVQQRLIAAYDVLFRMPASLGPKQFGNGWPKIVHDFSELIDEARLEEALRTGQKFTVQRIVEMADEETQDILQRDADDDLVRASRLPTSLETSMSEEALLWAMQHMESYPLQSHCLHLWAASKAGKWKMAPLLRRNALRADAMLDFRKRKIAQDWMNFANGLLKGATPEQAARIKAEARYGARREWLSSGRNGNAPRRADVMPGRVFTESWCELNRKKGAAILAAALHESGVSVR
jgi:hypothetical protein